LDAPRNAAQRKRDSLDLLEGEVDCWVASAAGGKAYLIPVSFVWDGERLTFATAKESRTAKNLRHAGVARIALGRTRDVVLIDGAIEFASVDADGTLADAHAKATGFDARRTKAEFVFVHVKPLRVQAWREENEIAGRDVMLNGRWLV